MKKNKATCLLGAHFSIAGGLHKALYTARAYACNTLQIFTKIIKTPKKKDGQDGDKINLKRLRDLLH